MTPHPSERRIVLTHLQALLNEPGCAKLLSDPTVMADFDLDCLPAAELVRTVQQIRMVASRAGVVNCIVWWSELHLGGEVLDLGPDFVNPRHMYARSVKQRMQFVGYERRVHEGEVRHAWAL